jgi:polar amino acid transport system substrate-binding protein
MYRILRVLLLPVLLLATGSNALATTEGSALDRIQERGKLILGTSGNMPSMSQIGSDGKVGGFDIDLALIMASLMEVELVIEQIDFDQLLPALEVGKVDVVISNVTITPKRNMNVAFVGPYLTSGKCIVSKDEALAKADQESKQTIANPKLAVLKGSTSEDFARQLFSNATVVTVEDFADAAEMVKNDEIGGMLTDYPICMAILKENPDAGFITLFSLLTYEPIGIALPANDAQFINWTQNFLNRLEATDTLEGLSQSWFGTLTLGQ